MTETNESLLNFVGDRKFTTILADPPWRFDNRTDQVSPEYGKVFRYSTMALDEICNLPVKEITTEKAHLYLWVPNALLEEGLKVMKAWGFKYKTNIVWVKCNKDYSIYKGGMGFYFRNATELMLFGVKGKGFRTLQPGRTQINYLAEPRTGHSSKPEKQYDLICNCSPASYVELFARNKQPGWVSWGNQIDLDT